MEKNYISYMLVEITSNLRVKHFSINQAKLHEACN